MQQIKRPTASNVIIAVANIAPAIATNGFSCLGLLGAGLKGFKEYDKYFEDARNNPAFIIWKTLK